MKYFFAILFITFSAHAQRMSPRVGHADRVWGAGLGANGLISACSAADSCVLDCGVGIFNGTEEWQCVNAAGAQVAVTQGAASTYEPTPFAAHKALANITDTSAAYMPAATADVALGASYWSSDHTVVAIASSGEVGDPVVVMHGADVTAGFYMQLSASGSGKLYCAYNNAAAAQYPYINASTMRKYISASCRRSGTNYVPRVDGVQGSTAITVNALRPEAYNIYFGRYNATGTALRGDLVRVRFYNTAITDAALATAEGKLFGTLAESRPITADRNSTASYEADDGYIYMLGDDDPRINAQGILSEPARTNYWLGSLNASAWTAVGTPIVTVNNLAGPFRYYGGTTGGIEADTVEDDSATVWEGGNSASAGTALGVYTASCYIAAGTVTAVQMAVITDGGGGGVCAFSGLTSAFTRKTCTPAAVTGTPTYIRGQILIGADAAATGTIGVVGCQLELGDYATSPIHAQAVALARVADRNTLSSAGLPTREGKIEFEVTPRWSSGGPAATIPLFDSRSGTNGLQIYVDKTSGELTAIIGDGTNTTQTYAALSWTAGTTYKIRYEYSAAVLRLFRDGVQVASTTASIYLPTAHAANICLGTNQAASVWCACRIRLLSVSR